VPPSNGLNITSIIPTTLPQNSSATFIQVNGGGFLPTSKGFVGNFDRETIFVNENVLSMKIQANDLQGAPHTLSITVHNGAVVSNAVTLTTTAS
jgi:hypothetical protein